MEAFYKRVHVRLIELERRQSWLLEQAGIKPSTWGSWVKYGRIPPADRALAIADALGVSVEFLVAGRETPFDFRRHEPVLTQTIQRLLDMSGDQLRRVHAVVESILAEEPDRLAARMEKLTDLLTRLAKHIESGKMTRRDKEIAKDLLNRLVLNIYEQKVEVKDEWANLESVE